MNTKYTYLLVLFVTVSIIACGQDLNEDRTKPPVTKEQYNAISKEIKTFDHNPTYQVRFKAVNCTYEIYVNDMLATFSFTTGNSAGEQHADIPQYILGSGPQEIKVKLFPKAIEDGKLAKKLGKDAVFTGRVVHREYGVTDFDSFTEVTSFNAPASGGKPGAELKVIFDAQVPYTLKGWESGIDLGKENKDKLSKELMEIYDRFAKAYKNKDIASVASMIYNREKEVAQAFFFKSGEVNSYDKGWEKLSEEADKLVDIKVAQDAELRYFAGGKVVALLKPTGQDRDFPAIEGETETSYVYYALYLYRPRAGERLAIIR